MHAVAAQASEPACTLYANDPDLIALRGRRTVEGSGWQSCALGIGQRTQACLYKLYYVLFFHRWKKTRCRRKVYDRHPTFRPVAARKFCDPNGSGTWRTVIFGSIYYDGPNGPGRYHGSVRSENDTTYSRCN